MGLFRSQPFETRIIKETADIMTNHNTKNNLSKKHKKKTSPPSSEQHEFQAEIAGLLRLMVHSVYSNRDIFLRELISNGADACERLRQMALTNEALLAEDTNFRIILSLDKQKGTLTISDNGVGMNYDEMLSNLGTIAHSGTRTFLEGLENAGDASTLIGQFGVGFYSAFMVADQVLVTSRAAGSDAIWQWQSSGDGNFTIKPLEFSPADMPGRGTKITLHFKTDASEYAEASAIERIVREHSTHIPVPIILIAPVRVEEGKDTHADGTEDGTADGTEERQLTDGSALWLKPKSEISKDEYKEFYHYVSSQPDEPVKTIHYRAEGRHEYMVLLFIPDTKPFDLFDPARKGRVKLYVRRVFISDEVDLLPPWLRFVHGVVDSEDLPLNISREMLQNNPVLETIKKGITNRVVSELKKLSEDDPDAYVKFWETFGPVIKEGLYEDFGRREKLFDLVRFNTTASNGGKTWRSLKDYIHDMQENQTQIFYLSGDSPEALQRSPHLEGYRARGVEVLLLPDSVDAFWVQMMPNYDGKPFQSVTQGSASAALEAIPLPGKTDGKDGNDSDIQEASKPLTDFIRETLKDKVSDVRISARLAESPVCLVAPDHGPDRQLEKILAQQKRVGSSAFAPVLEINMKHPLIVKIRDHLSTTKDKTVLIETVWMLLDQARIVDGEAPSDPASFALRLSELMKQGL